MVQATFINMRGFPIVTTEKQATEEKKIININEINILYVFVSLTIFSAAAAVRFG